MRHSTRDTSRGLVSAYHRHTELAPGDVGEEVTAYTGGNGRLGFHIDLVFVPSAWQVDKQVFSCGQSKSDPCKAALHAHFPPNASPVVEVDTDSIPGLSAPGDSLLLCPKPNLQQRTCGKGSVSWIVSAPAGSTLYFLCAIHAWMQGTIHVT